MRFSSFFLPLLAAFNVAAQTADPSGPNPISSPSSGSSLQAGQTTTITWTPTTGGTVTLTLRYGDSANLAAGTVIASGVQNSGSYSWSVPQNIVSGTTYTVQIQGTSGGANYSPFFAVGGGLATSATVGTTTSSAASSSSTSGSSSTTSSSSSKSSSSSSSSSKTSSHSSSSSPTSTTSSAAKAPSNAAGSVHAGTFSGVAALFGALAIVV